MTTTPQDPKPRILIIDASPLNLAMAKQALMSAYEIILAPDCTAALPLVSSRAPRLVLLGAFGSPAAKALCSSCTAQGIPFLLSGADDMATEVAALESGAADYIRKPYQTEILRLRVKLRLAAGVPAPSSAAPKQPSSANLSTHNFSGITILAAEDVPINRMILAGLLEENNIKLDFAENGLEAVEKYVSQPTQYAAILMDVQMPILDGIGAVQQIRASGHPTAQSIPIIAMSANSTPEEVAAYHNAGMNDSVSKPLDGDVLVTVLLKALSGR